MSLTLFESMPARHPEPPATKVVVQHNALVNARFDLSTVEMRLFMAMLSRVGRDDDEFREMLVPLNEVVALSGRRPSVKDYQQVEAMCDQLVSRVLRIERPAVGGRRGRGRKTGGQEGAATPDFDKLPLMAYAKYRGAEGALRVRFNDEVMPYLLQLHKNFTKAQVAQLLKLKSPHSYRIYWLLKEYATFGARTLGLDELKGILSLEGQYKQFPLFKLRVLDKAQQELSQTDLPFEYELLRVGGKAVTHIKFTFQPLVALVEAPLVVVEVTGEALPDWHQVLLGLGLAASSLETLVELVRQGAVTPDYVAYVVRVQREKYQAGKLKSLAGAVFAAVTKRHLLAEFDAWRRPATPLGGSLAKGRTLAAPRREKLLGELEDARTSLRFVRSAASYTDESRAVAVAEVETKIAQLEGQLQQLKG